MVLSQSSFLNNFTEQFQLIQYHTAHNTHTQQHTTHACRCARAHTHTHTNTHTHTGTKKKVHTHIFSSFLVFFSRNFSSSLRASVLSPFQPPLLPFHFLEAALLSLNGKVKAFQLISPVLTQAVQRDRLQWGEPRTDVGLLLL